MKYLRKSAWLALLLASSAWATTPVSKTLDSLNATGGSALTVPSVGSNLVSDTSTIALTNKTLSSTTDVIGGVTMTLGSDATGDIYYRNSGGVLTRLAIGTTGQALTVSGGLPSYSTVGGTWTQEDVLGCNGTATSFTLANTPTSSGVVSLYQDGLIIRQGAGKDYTISGASITLASACSDGQKLYAVYTH